LYFLSQVHLNPYSEESKQIFCWVEIVREEKVCAGDLCLPCGRPMPVHTGDKALTQETPAQRGGLTTGMLPIITSQLMVSSTNKTGRHDITEILLKVALTQKNPKTPLEEERQ
jgi:hypothetical protein